MAGEHARSAVRSALLQGHREAGEGWDELIAEAVVWLRNSFEAVRARWPPGVSAALAIQGTLTLRARHRRALERAHEAAAELAAVGTTEPAAEAPAPAARVPLAGGGAGGAAAAARSPGAARPAAGGAEGGGGALALRRAGAGSGAGAAAGAALQAGDDDEEEVSSEEGEGEEDEEPAPGEEAATDVTPAGGLDIFRPAGEAPLGARALLASIAAGRREAAPPVSADGSGVEPHGSDGAAADTCGDVETLVAVARADGWRLQQRPQSWAAARSALNLLCSAVHEARSKAATAPAKLPKEAVTAVTVAAAEAGASAAALKKARRAVAAEVAAPLCRASAVLREMAEHQAGRRDGDALDVGAALVKAHGRPARAWL